MNLCECFASLLRCYYTYTSFFYFKVSVWHKRSQEKSTNNIFVSVYKKEERRDDDGLYSSVVFMYVQFGELVRKRFCHTERASVKEYEGRFSCFISHYYK